MRMVLGVVSEMAPLAERSKIARLIVLRLVIKMRDRENNTDDAKMDVVALAP